MKTLYRKLAVQNLLKNGKIYLPYIGAQVLMVALFYNMIFLSGNRKIILLPAGDTIQSTLAYGALVMAVFVMCFLFYVNRFLMKQRTKEYGLYQVLGMEETHLKKVVFYETGIAFLISYIIGILSGIIFSGLTYMILLHILGAEAVLELEISGSALLVTFLLFGFLFLLILMYNLKKIKKTNPREMLQETAQGEREPRTKKGIVVIGIFSLAIGYGIVILVRNIFASLFLFFVAAVFVIIGTYALFTAGSIAFLKKIKEDKNRYYTPKYFTAVSGLLYRMKQNAAGLAGICILSTMILVTCSVSASVYCGQKQAIQTLLPSDIVVTMVGTQNPETDLQYVKNQIGIAAKQEGISVEKIQLADVEDAAKNMEQMEGTRRVFIFLSGTDEQKYACSDFLQLNTEDGSYTYQSAYYFCKQSPVNGAASYQSMYGGLLFLGIFLGILFMTATVLMIYYKQISEGYEDRQRYTIMKKVGMSDAEIKGSIRSQVLLVFALPLVMASIHILVALISMIRICSIMSIGWTTVILCTLGTLVIFSLIYVGVYKKTARIYYLIVNS